MPFDFDLHGESQGYFCHKQVQDLVCWQSHYSRLIAS
ncbi:hypothetical protein BMETH_966_1 [methanotrophic bacterial endosymbiont of Bathymodiolus sp.]|nr:hypothetical protein BMETH_966_1 [methanotrophic bacterial endosymbiont of Bathymodiolus sp.]